MGDKVLKSKMQQIGQNWKNIRRLTKIYVKENFEFFGLDGEKRILKSGYYYISGFWADAMGLSNTLKEAKKVDYKYIVPSRALEGFYK